MGTKAARKSEPAYWTAVAPSTEPAKAPAAGQAKRRRSTCPARQKVRKADPVPLVLCRLFVASPETGGTDRKSTSLKSSHSCATRFPATDCQKKKHKEKT